MTSQLAMEKLAALLRAKRGKKGLRETAKEIGDISPSTLSRVEQGKVPDLDTFTKLCNWLNVAPENFFDSDIDNKVDAPPIPPGATTPEIIEVHLRADKELDPETAEALAEMVRAAYNAVVSGKLGRKK
jgi:transcriptional regulator with XRE-family HTH domain